MIQIYDLRVGNIPAEASYKNQTTLLTHCTSDRWQQAYPILSHCLPLNLPVVLIESNSSVTAIEASLSQVETHFFSERSTRSCWVHVVIPMSGSPSSAAVGNLIEIVATLRSPTGCPWDRAQTPISLTPYIVEEAYEAVAAIRSGDTAHAMEELGDLLLQVVLQSQIFSETQDFSLAEVAEGISSKLIRRHPHVFGPTAGPTDVAAVKQRWEEIKSDEKSTETLLDTVTGYADTFPPLLAATKIAKKTAQTPGLNGDLQSLFEQIQQQLSCLRLAVDGNDEDKEKALGQLLFLLAQVGQRQGIKASTALEAANRLAIQQVNDCESPY